MRWSENSLTSLWKKTPDTRNTSFKESMKKLRRKGKLRRSKLHKGQKKKVNSDSIEKKGLVNMHKLRKMLLPEEILKRLLWRNGLVTSARKSLRRKANLTIIWAPKSIKWLKQNCERKLVSMMTQNYSSKYRLINVNKKWKRFRKNNRSKKRNNQTTVS